MAIIFITVMLLFISLLGRATNAICFAPILKPTQTKNLQWLPLDFASGCVALIIISQILLILEKFTPQLTLGALILLIILEITILVFQEKNEYLWINQQYIIAMVFVGLATTLLSIHAPGFWDDTSYHLIVARDFANNGDLTPNLYLRYPFAPFNVDLLFALCFFIADFDPVSSVYYCQAIANAPLFFIAILLCAALHQVTHSISCVLIGITLFIALRKSSITVHTGYAYVDYMSALLIFVSFYFLILIRYHKTLSLYLFLGVIIGIAAGCKYQNSAIGATILLCAGIYLIQHRMYRQSVCILLSSAVFGCYWYVRNLIQDGNPVDPFLIDWFGSKVWQSQDFIANANSIRFEHPRGLKAIGPNNLYVLLFIWILVLLRWGYVLIKYRSNSISKLKISDYISLGLTCYSLCWLEFFPIPRYLLPVEGVLIVYAVFVCHRYCRKLTPLVILPFLIMALVYRMTLPIPSTLKSGLLQKELFVAANELSSPADLLLTIDVQERNKYFYQGTTVGDLYGNARFSDFYQLGTSELINPQFFLDKMNQFNTKRAIVSTNVLSGNRINEYKQYFHFIKSIPEHNGGYLFEPLQPLLACHWLPIHSKWMETSVSQLKQSYLENNEDIYLTFAGMGINKRRCNRQITSPGNLEYDITIQLVELYDWSQTSGEIRISDDLDNIWYQGTLADLKVAYSHSGQRVRSVKLNPISQFDLANLRHFKIHISDPDNNGGHLGKLYEELLYVEPHQTTEL